MLPPAMRPRGTLRGTSGWRAAVWVKRCRRFGGVLLRQRLVGARSLPVTQASGRARHGLGWLAGTADVRKFSARRPPGHIQRMAPRASRQDTGCHKFLSDDRSVQVRGGAARWHRRSSAALNCVSEALRGPQGLRGASEGPLGVRGDAGEMRREGGVWVARGSRTWWPGGASVLAGRWSSTAALRKPGAPIAPDGLPGAAALAERGPAPGSAGGHRACGFFRKGRQQPLVTAEFKISSGP
jgi:hypothetical protein